jgi:hypothetical protein
MLMGVMTHQVNIASLEIQHVESTSHLRGYKGTWETWPAPQLLPASPAMAPAAAADVTQPLERMVNFRLFRLPDGVPEPLHQTNMYQQAGRPAAAAYKPFLTTDKDSGRTDGYTVREWSYDHHSQIFNVRSTSAGQHQNLYLSTNVTAHRQARWSMPVACICMCCSANHTNCHDYRTLLRS